MNRYVDAAAVRAAIVKAREAALEHKPYGWEWENNGYNGAILAAGRVPAADVRPVKRGKWLAASRLVLQPINHCDESMFWSMIMPPGYKPDNALLVVSALCDCCRCWHVAVRDAGSAIDDYHTRHIPLPWFCPTCGADMRPEEVDADA